MIKCLQALCAQQVIRDADSNNVSIISIIEQVNLPTLPGVVSALDAVFLFTRDEGDAERPGVLLRVLQGEQKIFEVPVDTDFQGKLRTRTIVHMGGLPIQAAGILRFGVALPEHDDLLGWWDILINVTALPMVRALQS